MNPNIVTEIASALGMAGGLWALVRWSSEQRRENGNGHNVVPIDPAASLASERMTESIAALPKQLEGSLKPLTRQVSELIGHLNTPAPTPAWAIAIAEHLASSDKRMAQVMAQLAAPREEPAPAELAWPPEMKASFDCMTDRLEALIQMGPPHENGNTVVQAQAPPELAELVRWLPGEIQSGFERLAKGREDPAPSLALTESIAELPKQLEGSLEPLSRQLSDLIAQLSAPAAAPPTPEWAHQLVTCVGELENRMAEIALEKHLPAPAPAWPAEVAQSFDRLTERLDGLVQPVAAEPELAEVTRTLAQLPGEIQGGFERLARGWEEWSSTERRFLASAKNAAGGGGGGGGGSAPPAHSVLPPQPKAPNLTLTMFNTWNLASNTVYTLTPPEPGIYALNMRNLGPGDLYIRADADPAPGDPQSAILPKDAPTRVFIPASLRILVDQASEVTAWLVHQ